MCVCVREELSEKKVCVAYICSCICSVIVLDQLSLDFLYMQLFPLYDGGGGGHYGEGVGGGGVEGKA